MPEQFGCIDVPNLRMIFFKNGEQKRIIDTETVAYYEEHLGANEDEVIIEDALFEPAAYEFLIAQDYDEIWLYRNFLIRSSETGDDINYFPPTLKFKYLTIAQELNNIDPTRWRIKLWK